MDEAANLVRSGDAGQVWIVADRQEGGRGRNGRVWVSERGNLYATLLLVDPCPVAKGPQLGFVTGLALRDALGDLTGLGDRLRLKWPNDALIDGAKLAGVLLEGAWTPAARYAISIGIGVNLATHPEGVAYPTTDLEALGYRVEPSALIERFSDSMVSRLDQWRRGDDFEKTRKDWSSSAAGLNETISVTQDGKIVRGVFREIDREGRLVLDTAEGTEVIHAGDVALRSQAA